MNSIDNFPGPQEISDRYISEIKELIDTIPENEIPFDMLRKFNYEFAENFIEKYVDQEEYLEELSMRMCDTMYGKVEIRPGMTKQKFFMFVQVTFELFLLHLINHVVKEADAIQTSWNNE